jgi:glycosyltransferase involved in cell wall biosynthesis
MRIGIDAKWYFTGPVSGRVVIKNLLEQLFLLYPEHTWFIFLDKKDKHLPFPHQQKNINLVYIWADNNMLANVFVLPGYATPLTLDVMVFQNFVPFLGRFKKMSVVFDILFESFPEFFTWKERLYFKPIRFLTRYADRVIVNTKSVKDDFILHGYASQNKINVVPLAVGSEFKPLSEFSTELTAQVARKYKLPAKFLLFVGRLNVRKNIENILRALPLLEDPTLRLVIVGKEDWKSPQFKPLLTDERINSRVQFTGSVTDEQLPVIYALSHIFCFPSFAEGFGIPPLEAMASGVPVIVSNTTSLPEVCGEAGNYIDPHSPQSIAEMIDKLTRDVGFYRQQQAAGIRQAQAFTWANTARLFMESVLHLPS